MDQVKQWYGSMKNEENELLDKERNDDSENDLEKEGSSAAKKTTNDTGSDQEWTRESEDQRLLGHSNVIHRAFNLANTQSCKSNKTSISCSNLATSLELQSADKEKSSQPPALVADADELVTVDSKQMPNLASGLDVMSQKESVIELNSSSIGKVSVQGSSTTQGVVMVQSRDNTNVFTYKCEKCSKMFDEHIPSSQALKRSNSEVHTDDKRYKCETCGKIFQRKCDLRRHLIIHTGEKPYKCEICEKGFTRPSNLSRHIWTNLHFNCEVCNNGFDNEQDKFNHLETMHSDMNERSYKCDTCAATFKRKDYLKQHTAIHTGEKPHVCEMQDTLMQSNINVESANPITVSTVVKNEQPEEIGKVKIDSAKLLETKTQKNESMEIGVDKQEKTSIKPKIKTDKATTEENADLSNEEYIVDRTLVKRFNTKKRYSEFVNKWKCYPHEKASCESAKAVAASKSLLDQFERSHAKQKETKEAQKKTNTVVGGVTLPLQKSVIKTETSQPGPSTTAQERRSMRSSKLKAMDQLKKRRKQCRKENDKAVMTQAVMKNGESEDQRLLGHSNVIHHREVHTDDKRYKCETCDKTFQYKSLLNRHLLIHTGEKPYKCEFCEKGFT
ncbi:PREDICTED: zinc finger protein 600-like, partial [Trachymyrmex septentrionalis]|uniref:zinc finger protein 600-like n=1 Tax=Trachymyrmex septentrionalis TaxID=34720 RepID=UPI00084F75C0